ncbi:MafI family immunity protein [Streptomyces formicae]|uniref:MafI family immunity protein n=1 Tax=Streptomyces formicae TaxID=1616117 RepID=A0ABY3WLA5_9ACTN|nr:MafI family immunity protein [Streptomyces formicae]UNM12249.1 MafI family immunity protein [Streptomyces formicae]
MEAVEYVAKIEELLEESPITAPLVAVDVRDLLTAGEFALAFDTMCSWIYEDELSISEEYYERLVRLSEDLGSHDLIARMRELVTG